MSPSSRRARRRLDATNVLVPLVAGVTNIQIDHVEYLGATREEIAFEKAGIFKPGVPAIVGEPDADIRALLVAHARGTAPRPSAWCTTRPR